MSAVRHTVFAVMHVFIHLFLLATSQTDIVCKSIGRSEKLTADVA